MTKKKMDGVSKRITIRVDAAMAQELERLQDEAGEENGGELVPEAVLARMLIRSALKSDMQRAAVVESLATMYRLNQLLFVRLRQMLENDSATLLAEIADNANEG